MEIKKVCVVGIGVMGNGITQVSAQAGYDTSVVDLSDEILQRGLGNITKSLSKFVEKGKLTEEEMEEVVGRIKPTTDLKEGAKDADFVIEAVFERSDAKKEVFKELDEICPPDTILASNTSTIPISLLGSATKRPEKVMGTHFMNPVPLMRGVEMIRSLATSENTLNTSLEFIQSLGKETAVVKDSPGFVTNRLMPLILNEAAKMYEEGLSTVEDADKIVRLSFNWPMGPFQLFDLIGIDTICDVLEAVYTETGWERYKPAPIIRRMVEVGWTGRKAKKGFYEYTGWW
ncbi:MAG: 3-hydroxyacyl-CoA dehydrogenase family protein [Candidatus Methanolliviera hydrocarbonicum]|uniref:3-hydroxyacyl-CoA dehydrogenase family protein n=1 Tax=Candidatus Methanolliviera hydrocarbonicum TaxID=2491085 RepID=A0A520KXV5_9EURY|nr:MAG: 3-hydroxyacyl-CoA dehydrogenase family protein [Candidatus Methanolliviera hydrocarbonicum]